MRRVSVTVGIMFCVQVVHSLSNYSNFYVMENIRKLSIPECVNCINCL